MSPYGAHRRIYLFFNQVACATKRSNSCAQGGEALTVYRLAVMQYLLELPTEALLTVLHYLAPVDVARLQLAFPRRTFLAVTRDASLWHNFFIREFGRLSPARLFLTDGALDWQRVYAETLRRQRRIDALRAAGWGFRSAVFDQGAKSAIRVSRHGNMFRISSATSDDATSPIVVDGRYARFDWSRKGAKKKKGDAS